MEARDFIADLLAFGMKQTEIAERVGMRQGTVSKVFTGTVKDVLSTNYRKLQALHSEELAKRKAATADAPREAA